MLAIRPFLFGLVETCVALDNPGMTVPMPIQLLLQVCLESAKKTVYILDSLHDQTLLGALRSPITHIPPTILTSP